jgi:cytochrome c-type biogenesis protein CcmE
VVWKYVIGALIVLPIVAHLVYAGATSPLMNYYVTVDEFARQASASARVGGRIAPGSINYDYARGTLNFVLQGDSAQMPVSYRGPAPNTFRDNVEAIVEGTRAANGSFAASGLMVKCPHSYLP